jgi:hypothetical protein
VRTGEIEINRHIPSLGPIRMTRGDYRWRITIPDDGAAGQGTGADADQWDVPAHPADLLPTSGDTGAARRDAPRSRTGAHCAQEARCRADCR